MKLWLRFLCWFLGDHGAACIVRMDGPKVIVICCRCGRPVK